MELLKYVNSKFKEDVLVERIDANTLNYKISREMHPMRSWWDSPNSPAMMIPGRKTIDIEIVTTDTYARYLISGQDVTIGVSVVRATAMESNIEHREITLTDICILESQVEYNRMIEDYEYTIKLTASTIDINQIERKVV